MPPKRPAQTQSPPDQTAGLLETLRYCWTLLRDNADPVHKERLRIIAELVKGGEPGVLSG